MRRALLLVTGLITLAAMLGGCSSDEVGSVSDDDRIRDLMIQESMGAYSGNCPCPYNRDSAGRTCGGRSAYSRSGGEAPLCYRSDISDREVAEYRTRHGLLPGGLFTPISTTLQAPQPTRW